MLKGLSVIVTGGASGLGRATVERFCRQGAHVTMVDLKTSDGGNVVEEIGSSNVKFVPTDITNSDDVANAIKVTLENNKKLDVLINCAGIAKAYKVYNFRTDLPHKQDDFEQVFFLYQFPSILTN